MIAELNKTLRDLPEKIDYFYWQGYVDNLVLKYRVDGREESLITITALTIRILESLYSEVEGWSEELIAQQVELEPLPNPYTFLGLLDSFLVELKVQFAQKDELSTNSFVKIGTICLRMINKGERNVGSVTEEG
jgi:hypothetical protein